MKLSDGGLTVNFAGDFKFYDLGDGSGLGVLALFSGGKFQTAVYRFREGTVEVLEPLHDQDENNKESH